MKRAFIFLLSIIPLFLYSQQKYKIQGHVPQLKNGSKLFLHYSANNQSVKDSSIVKNGKFSFSGEIVEPTLATLYFTEHAGHFEGDVKELYLDGTDIKVNGKDSIATANILNSKLSAEYEKYKTNFTPLSYYEGIDYKKRYILENPSSYISLDLLASLFFPMNQDYSVFEQLSSPLDEKIKNGERGQRVMKVIDRLKFIALGAEAPEIVLYDTTGNVVKLSDLRGKYVLIDFWASWCKPCREENPFLSKVYHEYKDKDFTILGVSLDNRKSDWLKAIQHDNIDWLQVSGEQGKPIEAASTYYITGLPQNFLVDKEGKIIAKNLRGDDLIKYMKELF